MTSAAIPRAAKISTARGLNSSAINTFGIQFRPRLTTKTRRWVCSSCSSCLRGERHDEVQGSGCLGGVLLLLPGPVEPGQQRLDIALLDGCAGPDPDAGRRGAVARQIVSDALGFEPRGHPPDRLEPRLRREPGKPRIDDREFDR